MGTISRDYNIKSFKRINSGELDINQNPKIFKYDVNGYLKQEWDCSNQYVNPYRLVEKNKSKKWIQPRNFNKRTSRLLKREKLVNEISKKNSQMSVIQNALTKVQGKIFKTRETKKIIKQPLYVKKISYGLKTTVKQDEFSDQETLLLKLKERAKKITQNLIECEMKCEKTTSRIDLYFPEEFHPKMGKSFSQFL